MRTVLLTLCLLASVALPAAVRAAGPEPQSAQPVTAKPFELLDGDRVAFVGGTFFEREAKLGYIETALTSRFPGRNITFRNLGYAGDTVRCEGRTVCEGWANFGPPDEGFEKLKKLVAEIKPTVVFVAYGMGESFEGEEKLPQFVKDYERLLDMLAEASGGKPRFVLIGPNYHEDLGRPLPDPAAHNRQLKSYGDAIAQLAGRRGIRFVDLIEGLKANFAAPASLTEDGIQLNPRGYLLAAGAIESSLLGPRSYQLEVGADGRVTKSEGLSAEVRKEGGALQLTVRPAWLPLPPIQTGVNPAASVFLAPGRLVVDGLVSGTTYALNGHTAQGKAASSLRTDGKAFGRGFSNPPGVSLDLQETAGAQAESLRQLIVAKNADYFNYWRHENDTYILGYRKHEQGKNAVELPQFIPLAEEKDKEINKLKVPQPVTYTLEKQAAAGK